MSRASWIQLFLYLHVLGAIASFGPNLTYLLWLRRAEARGPEHRPFVLATTQWIDDRLATPAYVAQAATGIALILLLEIDFFDTAWLLLGVGLYVLMSGVAMALWRPALRRQTALAERVAGEDSGGDRGAYEAAARRALGLSVLVLTLVIAILYFMIVKPPLWSAG